MKSKIEKTILIEDLVEDHPFAIKYLSEKGIRCIRCGEPTWGTLEEAAKEKNFNNEQIERFVEELRELSVEFKV